MRGEARGTRDEKHEQTGIRSSLIPHPSSLRREAVLLGLLVAVCLVMGRLSPVFLRVGNLLDMTRHMVEVGLVALAMTLVILTAGIDLSPGSTMGLASVTLGLAWRGGLPITAAAAAALLVAGACGALNGALVAWARLPALIV